MEINIVLGMTTLPYFKRSIYYKHSLGMVATVEKNGTRVYNDKDKFAHFYNSQYSTTIYGQGNIGNIKFYLDHYIIDDTIAIYSDIEEFIFKLDTTIIRDKGVDFYIGHLLKNVAIEHDNRIEKNLIKKKEVAPLGDANKILNNPGNVRYDDLKEYMIQQNKNRML